MSTNELYVKDARVWVPHPEHVWQGAYLTADFKLGDTALSVCTDSSQNFTISIKNESDLPPLRNPAILIGQNDLTALSYLHEPDVLHNLEVRFCKRRTIYTYCGIVLVAINPYADLPLYGPDIIRTYRGHSMGELEPHIFAVAEEAYAKLERENCDLSIIVSGESGAGKTVSAKYAMRYFAAVGGSESETQIERKVLASSPIMESIGNAKTTRNDNSSRFGKFTKLLFTNEMNTMSLTGGTMQTYLLEKSRVVFQAGGERNYHVFYQLCAARAEWPELMLDHQDKFKFLNQGKSPNINRVSDSDMFAETITAFTTLGFSQNEISEVIKIVASILHLGNIKFDSKFKENTKELDLEGCTILDDDLHLNVFAEILQLDVKDLHKWLITRKIESIGEVVLIPMNQSEADAARNALAKHMYSRLFQYVVDVINKSLDSSSKKQNCFIGVLDIYGFETFDINSFEQFCINYANEKLQQQFNQHVFKLEQDEYLKEGIVWTMIDFYDNQPCIDMIESKLGILDLLDEECRMPGGSDESWVGKLIEKCVKYKHFDKPRYGTVSFSVKHFSDTVKYESLGFLEKNRDTVSKELVNVLRESRIVLCQKLMQMEDAEARESKSNTSLGGRVVVSASKTLGSAAGRKRLIPSKQHKQTVGSQFRDSLAMLITTLHSTTPHYVRCIKPNEEKRAFAWDPPKIVQQLRACGVLETIRISAAGFPSRWQYENFYDRYRLLCKRSQIVEYDVKASCGKIVQNFIPDVDKYRFGNTQIFFRAGQVAYLEQVRSETRRRHIVVVQSMVRRFIYRRRYLRLRRTALGLQARARGYLARIRTQKIRQTRAAITIQRYVRGWMLRTVYERVLRTIIGLQTRGRGMLARKKFANTKDSNKATKIQRYCRGYLARVAYKQKLRKIVVCQSAIRRFLARRFYKKLKAEARTISHMQKMYKGLENKIISLQQRIDELNKDNNKLKQRNSEIPDLKLKLESMRQLEVELRSHRIQLAENVATALEMNRKLDLERDEKMVLLLEKERIQEKWDQSQQELRRENDELLVQMKSMADLASVTAIENSSRVRKISEQDTNEIHQAYQRALKDKEHIEAENQSLKQELSRLSRLLPSHSRSISNASSNNNDEDFGYSSAKNTLEMKKNSSMLTPPTSEKFAHHNNSTNSVENHTPESSFNKQISNSSTPKMSETTVLIKLRRICEEEREKRKSTEALLERYRSTGSLNTEDSLRASELEVENDKLRQDYMLLRNSIQRGVQSQELEAQYAVLLDEHKRRRDECIQLKAILAQQSQSLRTLGSTTVAQDMERFHDESELIEAFQAQKLVNRQLESELTALTEESSAKLSELSRYNDELRADRTKLEEISQMKLREEVDDMTIDTHKQNDTYMRYEILKGVAAYTEMNEQLIGLNNKIMDIEKKNKILANRLRENGLDDSIRLKESSNELAVIKKRAPSHQGIFKYDNKDRRKILQKLIIDLTPRVAITLLPGLPAYIVFMCIRYTDLLNSDNDVRTLLTDFIKMIKKLYRLPNTTECRVLWLVNCIKLRNLLKQYGGIDEYMNLNTTQQNHQQLKNFDLSEYGQVFLDTIHGLHGQTVRQVQEVLKPHIVPAILDHDEMARGKNQGSRGRTISSEVSPSGDSRRAAITEPKTLANQLDHFYKQFEFFGLDGAYIEQIFMQLMYYVCAISLNNLMLRQEMCMWKTGMKIRYNLSCLEEWIRKKNMPNDVLKPLQPLIQVSSLLQSRKSEVDVDSVCELCTNLTTAQVLKIIKSYTLDDCEEFIQPIFIEKLEQKLNERSTHASNDVFTMDEDHLHPFRVNYKYDDIKLEDIELPTILNLDDQLHKI